VRTTETARALAELGLRVGIVTDNPGHWFEYEQNEFHKRRFPFWLRLFAFPSPLLKLLHYSKDLPHSNSFLYLPLTDSGFFWRILMAGRQIEAGILQAEFPAYAKPCLEARDILHCKVVLVEHNIEYQRLRAQVPELSDAQYLNLRDIELDLCRRSDAVVCVSDNDRQILVDEDINPQRLHTISHGVHLGSYAAPAETAVRQRYGIPESEPLLVYHGTFSYPPNRQALQIFAEILLPGLERKGLICHVLAVGREPLPDSPHQRIHFTGSVIEVAPWLKAADMSVIPLTDGGGTRMKIVDCFAAGLPVISTSKGIEGIPVEPGRQALIIDDWNEMIDAILELWQNPGRRAALAEAAAAMAADLDWIAVGRRYRKVYSGIS
jgi:glycosyltransferase involved in cell wall biosynthesis